MGEEKSTEKKKESTILLEYSTANNHISPCAYRFTSFFNPLSIQNMLSAVKWRKPTEDNQDCV